MTADDPGRYIIKVEAFAAAGPLEISEEDLAKDHTQQIKDLIESLRAQDADSIEDSVYRAFRYDLCAQCHRKFLQQPKPGLQGICGD